jgi:hypothetical protein
MDFRIVFTVGVLSGPASRSPVTLTASSEVGDLAAYIINLRDSGERSNP